MAAALQAELRSALALAPTLRAVWLGLESGVTLAAAGPAPARRRLTADAPDLLARRAPGRAAQGVAAVPVDDEKVLLGVARAGAVDEASLAAMTASASRLSAALAAWQSQWFPSEILP